MSLQVCEHPKCKKLTLMSHCEEHRDELFEDDEDEPGEDLIEPREETVMNGNLCTYRGCASQSAENSKMCEHHRDQKARANAKYQGRETDIPKPARKYTKRTPTITEEPAQPPAIAPVHAVHRRAPIVLAEPTIVNGGRRSEAVTVLDSFITKLESDLAALKGAREVLQSHPE